MDPDTITTTLDLSPFMDVLMAVLAALASLAVGLISRFIHQKTGIDLDLKHNAILNEAIERGLEFAQSKMGDGKITIQTKHRALALAATYVSAGAPKAMTYFGITEQRLIEMIEARLGVDLPDVPTVAPVSEPEPTGT